MFVPRNQVDNVCNAANFWSVKISLSREREREALPINDVFMLKKFPNEEYQRTCNSLLNDYDALLVAKRTQNAFCCNFDNDWHRYAPIFLSAHSTHILLLAVKSWPMRKSPLSANVHLTCNTLPTVMIIKFKKK